MRDWPISLSLTTSRLWRSHSPGTGNLPTPQDSSFPEEARRAVIGPVSGLAIKALQAETVSYSQALRVQLPFTEEG